MALYRTASVRFESSGARLHMEEQFGPGKQILYLKSARRHLSNGFIYSEIGDAVFYRITTPFSSSSIVNITEIDSLDLN